MFYKKLYIIYYTTFFSIFQSFAKIFTKETLQRFLQKKKPYHLNTSDMAFMRNFRTFQL